MEIFFIYAVSTAYVLRPPPLGSHCKHGFLLCSAILKAAGFANDSFLNGFSLNAE